jgi:hypothetical protein
MEKTQNNQRSIIDMCKEYYKNQIWSVEHGINPRCVNSIHLYIFADNNHMYLIMDDVMRTSLVETVKEKKTLLVLIVYILPFLYLLSVIYLI